LVLDRIASLLVLEIRRLSSALVKSMGGQHTPPKPRQQ